MNSLQELKKLTEKLAAVSPLQYVEFGASSIQGIYNVPDLAVGLITIDAGTKHTPHKHDEHLYLIVLKGMVQLIMEKGEHVHLHEKDVYVIYPGEIHSYYTPDGCTLLAVTLPASPSFPPGLNNEKAS